LRGRWKRRRRRRRRRRRQRGWIAQAAAGTIAVLQQLELGASDAPTEIQPLFARSALAVAGARVRQRWRAGRLRRAGRWRWPLPCLDHCWVGGRRWAAARRGSWHRRRCGWADAIIRPRGRMASLWHGGRRTVGRPPSRHEGSPPPSQLAELAQYVEVRILYVERHTGPEFQAISNIFGDTDIWLGGTSQELTRVVPFVHAHLAAGERRGLVGWARTRAAARRCTTSRGRRRRRRRRNGDGEVAADGGAERARGAGDLHARCMYVHRRWGCTIASSGGRGRASSAAACPSLGGRTPTSFTTARRPRSAYAHGREAVGGAEAWPQVGAPPARPASCAGHARAAAGL
jgi:hypothetical protein